MSTKIKIVENSKKKILFDKLIQIYLNFHIETKVVKNNV